MHKSDCCQYTLTRHCVSWGPRCGLRCVLGQHWTEYVPYSVQQRNTVKTRGLLLTLYKWQIKHTSLFLRISADLFCHFIFCQKLAASLNYVSLLPNAGLAWAYFSSNTSSPRSYTGVFISNVVNRTTLTLRRTPLILITSQQTRGIDHVFVQFWPIVCDAGPTLNQHMVNFPCLLGYLTQFLKYDHFAASDVIVFFIMLLFVG